MSLACVPSNFYSLCSSSVAVVVLSSCRRPHFLVLPAYLYLSSTLSNAKKKKKKKKKDPTPCDSLLARRVSRIIATTPRATWSM